MNNTYKTNKTDWRRLVRSTLFVALLLGTATPAEAQYVIMYDNNYLTHDASSGALITTSTTTFDPTTCFWSIDDNGKYLHPVNISGVVYNDGALCLCPRTGSSTYSLNTGTSYRTWDGGLSDGGQPSYGTRYLRLNSTTWQVSTTDSYRGTLHLVTKTPYSATETPATIAGPTTISTTGNSAATYTRSANASYTDGYIDYVFNSTSHYRNASDNANLGAVPTATAITADANYTWSLEGISSTYAEINASTGVVNYKSYVPSDQAATVKLTASAGGHTILASYSVTFEAAKIDPTSISVTTPMTVYVGHTETVAYTLTPSPCYNNVTYTSNNSSIATVNSSGVVTGVVVGTTTITVTAKKIDGTTNASLTGTITVNVRNRVETPSISFTPTGTGSTANCAITCATTTPSPTIRYTINGADPTTTTGTIYDGTPFAVNDNDEVRAIAVTDEAGWDNSAVATGTYVSCSTTAPVITYTQSGSTATVTIKAEDGATIYYTTNGNDPTESSANGTTTATINSVTNGTTVKAFAKSGTCQASAIVSKEIITSNVSTSVVTLYDYEPHSWAYYNKELNSPIRSWNPADVQITYYGEGKMYTSTSTTPSGDLSDVTSGTVRVGILTGETQNTFVYYKTLERTDGQTAANPSGRCAYRTIPNPFSVRPTFTSSDTKYYTGFYKWRVKKYSGGRIYTTDSGGDSVRVGGTVDAEQVLYFAPTSEYGMTVEFEDIWARAYIGGNTHVTGTNAYERNFYIGARTSALDYAATISAVYPDGTDGSSTDLLTSVPNTTQTSSYTCSYDTKFEYIQMGANITLTAANHYLALGRGCGTTNNVMTLVHGMEGNNGPRNSYSAYTSNLNYIIRIESGKMQRISCVNGNYDLSGTGAYGSYTGSNNSIRVVLGCDYDRAGNNITNLNIQQEIEFGCNLLLSSAKNTHTLDLTVKSGSISSDGFTSNPDGGDNYIYMGAGANTYSSTNTGLRKLTIEGGKLCNIAGGVDDGNTTDTAFTLRITGGEILGAVYGAAAFAATYGHRKYVITGGKIRGWIAGGCNGTTATSNVSGTVSGSTFMYLGGTSVIGYNDGTAAPHINSSDGGIVFGAGSGNELVNTGTNTERTRYATVGQVENSTIVLADEGYVQNNVYGGGNFGYVNSTGSNIYVMGGTVGGKVFGGSNQRTGKQVNIKMTGGTVIGGVYGGSNQLGTVDGPVSVSIEGGTVGESGQGAEVGHVFGSGYGSGTSVSGNVQVTIGKSGDSHSDSPLLWGNVYGGGHNAAYTSTSKTFQVLGQNGLLKGSIFGGGKGNTATITGPTDVLLKGHIQVDGNVYGGGAAATVSGNTSVRLQD